MEHLTLNPTIILFFCHFIIAPVKGDWIYLMGWVTQEKYKGKYKDSCNDKYTKGTTLKSNLWDLWPLRHLLRVMRKHDLTIKNTTTKTKTNTKTTTKCIEDPNYAIFLKSRELMDIKYDQTRPDQDREEKNHGPISISISIPHQYIYGFCRNE